MAYARITPFDISENVHGISCKSAFSFSFIANGGVSATERVCFYYDAGFKYSKKNQVCMVVV
jgi:hypothetical protein